MASSTRSASSIALGALDRPEGRRRLRPARSGAAADARRCRAAAVVTIEKSCSPAPGGLGLLHRVAEAELQRPQRPRRALVRARGGRLGQQLELDDRRRALADRVAHAVGAGVAAADDDDVLALGADRGVAGAGRPSGCGRRGSPSRSARRRARGPGPAGRAARASRWPARPRRTARAAPRR